MDMNELLDLRARFLAAKANNHSIGAASGYADSLEAEAGPADFDGHKHSPDHLLALVEKAILVRNAPKAPEKKAKPVKAEKAAPKESSPVDEIPSEPVKD